MSQPFRTLEFNAIQAIIIVNGFNVFVLVAGLGLLCFLLVRKQRVFTFVWFVILCTLMAGLTTPIFSTPEDVRSRINCTNGRVVFEMAINHWAKEKKISSGAEVDLQAVAVYMKGGTLPTCPQGGTYLIGKVGRGVTCTIEEHNKN